jgi:phosphoribosylformylglycinamidine synthase subunit PurL
MRRPEAADAAVLGLAESGRAIAVAIDGNGRRVACDPYLGTVEAVLECAQNLACVGAAPLGLTNCLNFGNPEKPYVAWQLDRSVQGLADACRALHVPVVGGNVSLYNETEAGPIYPTPVVGMVGELPDLAAAPGLAPRHGDAIALVGPFAPSLAGSELAKLRGELAAGLPATPVDEVHAAIELVREAARAGRISAAHDVSDGGLACALAECAIAGAVGLRADLDPLVELRGASGETALFGEGPGGFLVAGPEHAISDLIARGEDRDVSVLRIGEVGGEEIEIAAAEADLRISLADAASAWRSLDRT